MTVSTTECYVNTTASRKIAVATTNTCMIYLQRRNFNKTFAPTRYNKYTIKYNQCNSDKKIANTKNGH